MKFYNLILSYLIFLVFSQFVLNLPWAKALATYTKMAIITVPIQTITLVLFYHNILGLLHKPNILVFLVSLWVHILYLILYQIKSLAIMLILMSTTVMIQSNLDHIWKMIAVIPDLVIHPPKQPHQIHPNFLNI